MVPGLPIPPDVPVGQEGAQVPQGAPSPGVETPDSGPDAPSTTTGGAAPSPADAAPPAGGGSGKSSKSGDSGS